MPSNSLPISYSYRPHNPGHDYYDTGAYLITLVVRNRDQLLGHLNNDAKAPKTVLSELGKYLFDQWQATPQIQSRRGNDIHLLNQVVMPDHWHGVIKVNNRLNKSIGDIIQAVKSTCTSYWYRCNGYQESAEISNQIRLHMSKEARASYYATQERTHQPLFDDNYDDTICIDEEHLARMVHYVDDNPRRAIMRVLYPEYLRRCLHVIIDNRDYAAFGNLFLLRWACKVQVFCHRNARIFQLSEAEKRVWGYSDDAHDEEITHVPYIETTAFQQEKEAVLAKIMKGATVVVTPGISPGERTLKQLCIEQAYPLIHLQKEAIGPYWKPERARFKACERGSLLILAPWQPENLGEYNGIEATSDYSIFHNLNALAAQLCAFDGEAKICKV